MSNIAKTRALVMSMFADCKILSNIESDSKHSYKIPRDIGQGNYIVLRNLHYPFIEPRNKLSMAFSIFLIHDDTQVIVEFLESYLQRLIESDADIQFQDFTLRYIQNGTYCYEMTFEATNIKL